MRPLTHVRIGGRLYPLEKGHRWLAQDSDGEWYSFLNEPICESDGIWFNNHPDLEVVDLICTVPPKYWTKELYELY